MTGIIILCRYNSTRLPGKILKRLKGKPILQYLVERLEHANLRNNLVVCTSSESTDDPIFDYCNKHEIRCFRGDLNDVAQRFLDCALECNFTFAVRINGDNLFLDSTLITEMMKKAEEENLNFLSNVKGRTYPKGISVEIVKTSFYSSNIDRFNQSDHEHVMTYFYRIEAPQVEFIYNPEPIERELDFAIDTREDMIMAGKILDKMSRDHTEYGFREIIKLSEEISNEN
jgi:spore coat polysaccharide biosynthesis protein SpsF